MHPALKVFKEARLELRKIGIPPMHVDEFLLKGYCSFRAISEVEANNVVMAAKEAGLDARIHAHDIWDRYDRSEGVELIVSISYHE